MNIKERDAYRERVSREFARRSEQESASIADREQSGKILVRYGKGDKVILSSRRAGVRERGWQGIPQGIPASAYPNRPHQPKRIDVHAPTVTHREVGERLPIPEPTYLAPVKASVIGGRGAPTNRDDKAMKQGLDEGLHQPRRPNDHPPVICTR